LGEVLDTGGLGTVGISTKNLKVGLVGIEWKNHSIPTISTLSLSQRSHNLLSTPHGKISCSMKISGIKYPVNVN
jgi:hypothetical protein